MNTYLYLEDIAFLNSLITTPDSLQKLHDDNIFCDETTWDSISIDNEITEIKTSIKSRLKNRMSKLSLGIYNVLDNGPGQTMDDDEEICLFTGFGEIDTTDKIINTIVIEKFRLVSPTLFHNSVHHTSLGYYTIIKKAHNPCLTISDGLTTNLSFINYMRLREKINTPITIASGEEHSRFFALDKNVDYTITPTFTAYRAIPSADRGIKFGGQVSSFKELVNLDQFKNSNTIFADKESFLSLKNDYKDKTFLTEYPIVKDNPCGIVYRFVFPFCLGITGMSLVIEKIDNTIYYFEVNL